MLCRIMLIARLTKKPLLKQKNLYNLLMLYRIILIARLTITSQKRKSKH